MRLGGVSLPALLAVFLVLVPGFACGSDAPAAKVSAFKSPGSPVHGGEPAVATASIENTGAGNHAFFVGYSVRDPEGRWHDAPANRVELEPGEESGTIELRTPPLKYPGYYDERLSVWSGKPGSDGARRVSDRQTDSAFRVASAREDFDTLDPERWTATERRLGRGRLLPENVSVEGGQLRLRLARGGLGGAEIESRQRFGPGFFEARLKVPNAPSSITGFFLYAPPDLQSEVDIEVFNDPSGKILFTTYADGKQTHTEEMKLPFDPTQGFHDYAFRYDEKSITFHVDGRPMKTYEGGLPAEPMNLYVNAWFPTWLDGRAPPSDRYAIVDWIEWRPEPR